MPGNGSNGGELTAHCTERGCMMLVLARRIGERIFLSGGVVITVIRGSYNQVTIGIDAPPNVTVKREEIASPELAAECLNGGPEMPHE